jgi:sugar/nucleoside kinase (ribokinase family)
MSQRIVAIGTLTTDLIMPVALPVTAGQSIEVPWHRVEPGGAGNFLIAGQRLGAQMEALGALGDDLYGREAIAILRAEGVGVTGIAQGAGTTSTVVIVLFQPDTGQFAYVWRGGSGETVTIDANIQAIVERADALFVQGYTLREAHLRPLLNLALASDKPLYFDVGPDISGATPEDRAQVRARAQVILATQDELPQLAEGRTDQAAYDFLLSARVRLLVIKRGANGCRLVTRSESPSADPQVGGIDVPAFPVTVRDLVGAGDCFDAAFMFASLSGWSHQQAALLANAAGAAKVQKPGTGRSMPTRAEVQTILSVNGCALPF